MVFKKTVVSRWKQLVFYDENKIRDYIIEYVGFRNDLVLFADLFLVLLLK